MVFSLSTLEWHSVSQSHYAKYWWECSNRCQVKRIRRSVLTSEYVDVHGSRTWYRCWSMFRERACDKLTNSSRTSRDIAMSLRTSAGMSNTEMERSLSRRHRGRYCCLSLTVTGCVALFYLNMRLLRSVLVTNVTIVSSLLKTTDQTRIPSRGLLSICARCVRTWVSYSLWETSRASETE